MYYVKIWFTGEDSRLYLFGYIVVCHIERYVISLHNAISTLYLAFTRWLTQVHPKYQTFRSREGGGESGIPYTQLNTNMP